MDMKLFVVRTQFVQNELRAFAVEEGTGDVYLCRSWDRYKIGGAAAHGIAMGPVERHSTGWEFFRSHAAAIVASPATRWTKSTPPLWESFDKAALEAAGF